MALSFLQSAEDGSDLTTYTFSSQALGDAATDRYIIVSVASRGSGTLDSVTVGGITATLVANQTVSSNTSSLSITAVPTGTTGDVVVTFSAGGFRCGIGMWRVTGLSSATPDDTSVDSAANDITFSIDIPAGGFVIAESSEHSGGAVTATWSDADEDFEVATDGIGDIQSGASKSYPSGATAQSIVCDWSGAGTSTVGSAASWGLGINATLTTTGAMTGDVTSVKYPTFSSPITQTRFASGQIED